MTGGRTEGTGEAMVLALNKKRGGEASETVVALIMVSFTGSANQRCCQECQSWNAV